jgi:hypothetical protein
MSIQFGDSGVSRPPVDLAAFASRAREIDVGGSGGDDIVELGDDLGMGLLSNPNKVAASPKPMGANRQVSFGTGGGSGGGEMPQIQIRPVDDLDVVNLDAAPGAADISINRPVEPAPFVINTGGGGGSAMALDGEGGIRITGGGMTPEEESRQKQTYLTKLQRLESSGIKGQRMTMANSLEEIKLEHDKLTDSRNLEASIRFQRNALMTFVTGVEMVNDKFGHRLPVKPRLKGWSESVHTNIEDFDEIFEELYDLYKDKAKVHPLMRLVGTLGVSATMYHITNSMAERSGIPGMTEMMNEDPELQRIIMQKMAAKMGGLGQFMSAAGGFGGGAGAPPGMPMGPGPAPMGAGAPPPTPPRQGMDTRTPFNAASGAPPSARREMRGPSGVDDVLKAFETERLMQQANIPISSAHASVFAPSGPSPPSTSGVSILREGVGGLSDPLSQFGGGMDDANSIGTGSTMNTERRRGRRRVAATPVGATLDLNV